MSKQLLPKTTRDTSLAVLCFLFRIPVNRRRIYTEDFLKNLGINASQAYKARTLGQLEYGIHKDGNSDASKIIAAYEDEKAKIESGEAEAEIDIDPEKAARFAARILVARKNFMNDLFKLVPFLRIRHSGSAQKSPTNADGSYTMKIPGFVDVRLDADAETKKHLGLL